MLEKILSPDEIEFVLDKLERKAVRSLSTRQNLTIFRVVIGTGLRVSELAGINLGDITVTGSRPCIRVRKEVAKGKRRGRVIPLWWDSGCLEAVQSWCELRRKQGAKDCDPFLVTLFTGARPTSFGARSPNSRMTRNRLADRWKSALKDLPPDRVKQLSIHAGRHTFVSHALHVGRSLAEVRDAAGHANVSMTSHYLHALDTGDVPDLYS